MNHAVLVAKNLGRRKLRTFLMLVAIFIAFLLFAALEAFIPGVKVTAPVFAAGIGLALLLGLVTGAIPAWSALRLRIVTALGRN
jgi:putative ABC transport system permease protein